MTPARIPTRNVLVQAGTALLALIFGLSYRQSPLYTTNQNTYLVHGFANAGQGFLSQDWFARTADPFPAFSALVSFTLQFLSEKALYLEYILLLALFAAAILGICSRVFDLSKNLPAFLVFFSLLAVFYSGLLNTLASNLPGLRRLAYIVDPHGMLAWGVAGQYVLGPVLQPSVFGVFLLLSIYLFAALKPYWAAVSLAVAASLHATYLLSAGLIMAAFLAVITIEHRDLRKALPLALFALLMVAPALVTNILLVQPSSPDAAAQARTILADIRIPHHANPANWFAPSTYVQMALVIVAAWLVRRTRLFLVLVIPFLVAVGLTILQVLTGSKSLALLFPWRISVILVPLASALIAAAGISAVFRRFSRFFTKVRSLVLAGCLVLVLFLAYSGIKNTISLFQAPRVGLSGAVQFATASSQPGDVYLIPTDWESFRLNSRAPVFVDFKSHPYRDTEVLEWYTRVQAAEGFYSASGQDACARLEGLVQAYSVTHVVIRSTQDMLSCRTAVEVFRDDQAVIYRLGSK